MIIVLMQGTPSVVSVVRVLVFVGTETKGDKYLVVYTQKKKKEKKEKMLYK